MIRKLKKLRAGILVYLTHEVALPILKLVRNPKLFPYTEEELNQLPERTLGNDLARFLRTRNLQLLPYYARHDLKHIVLDYDTTEEGEACLQSFMLANGRISFPVLATVAFAFLTMPEYWNKMIEAFKRGRSSESIHNWKWYEILRVPTHELRRGILPK